MKMSTLSLFSAVVAGSVIAAAARPSSTVVAQAEVSQQQAGGRAPIQGLSRQPSEAAAKALFDPSDTVMLLLDHQTGLFLRPSAESSEELNS
jgi:hypothetical protein